jgi:hypothetical protein
MCEIGTHSKTSDHKFQMQVYELGGDGDLPTLVYSFTPDSYEAAGGTIKIDIGDPKCPGVEFFLPDFPQDGGWRQLIDFERLYGEVLKKKTRVQRPKITINNGRFFVEPSKYEFLLLTDESTPTVSDLGRIAFLSFGAVTQLGETGYVSITTDQEYLRLFRPKDKALILVFTNLCPQDECDPSRSDFQEYYKMFKRPPGAKKFRLQKKDVSISTNSQPFSSTMFLKTLFGQGGILFDMLSSQDSPCAAMGFGLGPAGTEEPHV